MQFSAPSWRFSGSRPLVLVAALAATIGLLGLSASPAVAARGHVFTGHFAEPGTGPGQLTEPAGVAVSETAPTVGDVYVVDKGNDRVERFSAAGAFLGQFDGSGTYEVEGSVESGEAAPTGKFEEPTEIAIDNDPSSPSHGDVYVVDSGHAVVDKFASTGEYLGQLGSLGQLFGVGVDTDGELWVYQNRLESVASNFTNAVVNEPIASRPIGRTESVFAVPGFAVDSVDNLYPLRTLQGTDPSAGEFRVGRFNSKGELLEKEVDPESSSGVATEPISDDVYVDNLTTWARFTSQGKELERLQVPGTHGSGIAVDATAGKVYVADSAEGVIDEFGPEPAGPPTIEAGDTSVTAVTADAATLEAEIDPRSEPTEVGTTWLFQYLSQSAWEADGGSFAGPDSPGVVPIPAGELAPSFDPEPVTARLQGLAAATTYHYRVVARNSHPGEEIGEEETFTTQSVSPFALPDGRQWEMVSPPDKLGAVLQPIFGADLIQASADGNAIAYLANAPIEGAPQGNSNLTQVLARRGPAGWESRGIASPNRAATGNVTGSGQEYRFFSSDLSRAIVQPVGHNGFTPLSPTATEQSAYLRVNYPSGDPSPPCLTACYLPLVTSPEVPAGTEFGGCSGTFVFCGPFFVGATPDLSHVVLLSEVPLVEGAPAGSGFGYYEWTAGRLSFLGQAPSRSAFRSISPDGSYVVFQGSYEGLTGLLLRDTVTGQTVELAGAGAIFQGAAEDGSRIFYSEGTTGGLVRYDLETGQTTELAPAGIQGSIPGVSADGSMAYFVATADLTGAEEDAAGETAQTGAPNLYLSRAGAIRLIAVLSPEDSPDWGREEGARAKQTARVSPDGRWLAFMSERPLTGYDNRDAISGEPDEEVYLYDAEADGGQGKLSCASCNPTGARPHGVEFAKLGGVPLVTGSSLTWAGSRWLASTIPTWTAYELGIALYQSRYLSNSGRLFFNSTDALVPQDTDGTSDVYEYEPPGVGSCTSSSPTYAATSGGCVGLISSGTSKEESGFLDASENGNDVFFLTGAQLSRQDVDTSLDLYDAHVCSGEAPCFPEPPAPRPECDGDACQQPAVPPVDATPGSLTFSGAGNVVECPKGKVKKAGKCVKKAQPKKHKKHKKKGHKKHHDKSKTKKNRSAGKGQGGNK